MKKLAKVLVRRCRIGLVLWLGGVCFVGLNVAAHALSLTWNWSQSTPWGFYSLTQDQHGAAYARVCLDGAAEALARLHGLPSHGDCPDGYFPVLKPVYPAGEVVTYDAEGFHQGGRIIPNTRPKAVSLDGVPLQHYPFGSYAPDPNHVWLVSSMKDSFDSRYFGPVKKSQILSYARPFLVTTLIH
jgi:conjugative transfer signal peptidase TraF